MTQETKQRKLIVLVEDEEILSNLLTQKLEKSGYAVKSALDGETGLGLILDAKPDLVLLDMLLPKMSGISILEKLAEQKILPALPIIVISNSGQPVEVDRAIQMGVRDYLIKINFNPDEVLEKVQKVLTSESIAPAEIKSSKQKGSDDAKNILIVEDDMFMAGLLERKFKREKFSILKASNANQAREVLASKKIDLILLDVVLPGMDGFTFLREIKASDKFKNIPVMITSNLGQQDEIDRGLSEGAVDYIVKAHSTPGDIVQKVENALK